MSFKKGFIDLAKTLKSFGFTAEITMSYSPIFSEKQVEKFVFGIALSIEEISVFVTKTKIYSCLINRQLIKLLAYVLPIFTLPIISNYMAFKIKNAV